MKCSIFELLKEIKEKITEIEIILDSCSFVPYSAYTLRRNVPMEKNDSFSKLKELILFVSRKGEKYPFYGATHLNKILYLADFLHFRYTGKPLTGVEYFKLQRGPAPKLLVPAREELKKENKLRIELRPITKESVQERPVALVNAKEETFTEEQRKFVEEIIELTCKMPAYELSQRSHDLNWHLAEYKEVFPYSTIHTRRVNPITASSKTWARELTKVAHLV